ncbi:hypothetical protein DPMN_068355 [Dreissena polymorpha]|uniref:Uncharacterized protein n=1 Tax=Dreissena polymorpha TaxID=45954 RepID=A0A9D3Z111_DREPO|nr:hypothetical protein DPMN_068355 [Dreissena polymorpha]
MPRRKKRCKGFGTQKYQWKKPKVTTSTDDKIPILSGLKNDSCTGNSPTCSNGYVQTCDKGTDHDYCIRLDDDSALLNTGFTFQKHILVGK